MVDFRVSFVHPKIPILRSFCSVQKSNILLFCPAVLPFGFSQNFRLNNTRRVVRVVEGAALEMLCSLKEPRVRIPNSPPKSPVTMRVSGLFPFPAKRFQSTAFLWQNNIFGGRTRFYSPDFSLASSASSIRSLHLLLKSPTSGSGIPLTIACAEESFEE